MGSVTYTEATPWDKRWSIGKKMRDCTIQGKVDPPIKSSGQCDISSKTTDMLVHNRFAVAEAMLTELQILYRNSI